MRIASLMGFVAGILMLASANAAAQQWTRQPTTEQIAEVIAAADPGFGACVRENGGLRVILGQRKEQLLSYDLVDLNGDSLPEVLVNSAVPCFLGARRPFGWVLGWRGDTLVVLLSMGANDGIDVAKSGSTNGYKNLETGYVTGIGTVAARMVFAYDGRQYKAAGCFEKNCQPGFKNCQPERRVRCP